MRGQGATEFLLILAFILLLIVPAGYYIFTQTQESSRVLQADMVVSELAKTADYVYYQAPGARQTVRVFIPGGVNWAESYVGHPAESGGREINLAVTTQTGGDTHVFRTTQGEVRGVWPDKNGNWAYTVRKMPQGYVLLSPYELTFLVTPQSYSATLEPLGSAGFTLSIEEISGESRGVSISAQGEIAHWITLAPSLELGADSENSTGVFITVPENTPFGLYEGVVQVTDGETDGGVFITIVVTGSAEPIPGFSGGLDVRILEPENSTYYDIPMDFVFTVNESFEWCGYSMDGGSMVEVSGNTTLLPTNGAHHLILRCVGSGGRTGSDEVWFTLDIGAEPWCIYLPLVWAFDSDYNDELERISFSDDIRADEVGIVASKLSFIEAAFALALSGDSTQIVIYNMTQWVEHYESNAQVLPVMQWGLSTGWGKTVCNLPVRVGVGAETVDMCYLDEEDVPKTPGKVETMSTRIFYLSQAGSDHSAFIDWVRFQVCYGEAIKWIGIDSPLNITYGSQSIWFNITSNANIRSAWYSLNGGANTSMNTDEHSAHLLVNAPLGANTVVFWANDTNGNTKTNSTQFTVDVMDTTPPEVTLASPANATYNVPWVWVNATTNEIAAWCGYSLDNAANVTMSGSGTSWFANASAPYGTHSVVAYCNDSAGNMGESATVHFTTKTGEYCADLALASATTSAGGDEYDSLLSSDNVRASVSIGSNSNGWISGSFTGSIPGGATILNATASIEHYESAIGLTRTMQWYNGAAWSELCGMASRIGAASEDYSSCDLADVDTVSEANGVQIRSYYTRGPGGPITAYVDHAIVNVCYEA